MNNTFNIKRFGLMIRKDLCENGKRYALLFLTLSGLIVAITIFMTWDHFYNYTIVSGTAKVLNRYLLITLSWLFCAAGIWFASTFSNPTNSKLKRLSYLVTPSSNLEKFLVRWILTTIGFIVAFFVALWIAEVLRVSLCAIVFPKAEIKFLDLSKLVYPDNDYTHFEYVLPKNAIVFLLSLYFFFQSIFLLGSTFSEKASFVKTFTFVATIIAAFIIICRRTVLIFYVDLGGFWNVMNSFEIPQVISETQALYYTAIFISVFTLSFWALAYFRIKESEIIKRF